MLQGGITHHQSCISLLLFKGKDLAVEGIDIFQNIQVILYILTCIKGVLTQQHGKLRLGADHGRQGLIVKLQPVSFVFKIDQAFQDAEGEPLLLG